MDQQNQKKIGIVIGSVRTPRKADSVSEWVHAQIAARDTDGVEWATLDLKDYELPALHRQGQAKEDDADADLVRWRDDVASCDGFLFITPEYNRAMPGNFKNAYDLLDVQWMNKPIAFVSYGGVGGARAVDSWRATVQAFNMASVGHQVLLYNRFDFDGETFNATDRHAKTLHKVIDELLRVTHALR